MIFAAKILISAFVLVIASEIAKRSPFWGALLIAMPLTSILSLLLLYTGTKSAPQATAFAREIFYLVPISLLFFVPFLFSERSGWSFWANMALGLALLSVGVMIVRVLGMR